MEVIFLDFDGVINNWEHFEGVDTNNLNPLLEIINKTGAKIVATTSNKYVFQTHTDIDFKSTLFYNYVKILNEHGIEIFDVTPYVNKDRELEIIQYLKMHPEIEQYLIFDDDYIIESLKEHQIFLDLYKGITWEHVEPAINILNGNLGFYPPDFNFNETVGERMVRINKYHAKK